MSSYFPFRNVATGNSHFFGMQWITYVVYHDPGVSQHAVLYSKSYVIWLGPKKKALKTRREIGVSPIPRVIISCGKASYGKPAIVDFEYTPFPLNSRICLDCLIALWAIFET